MRGEILSYDNASGAGLISGDDGIRYSFTRDSVAPPSAIAAGARVDFVPESGQAIQVMLLAAATPMGGYSGAPMQATDGTIDWGKLMFSFEGRIRRMHFGIAWLVLFGINLVVNFIPFLGPLLALVLIWPNLAISVKRLHDMGLTGWIAAVPYVVGLVAGVFAVATIGMTAISNGGNFESEDPEMMLQTMGPAFGILAIAVLISFGFLLWLVLVDGRPGTNKYGPNPKGL